MSKKEVLPAEFDDARANIDEGSLNSIRDAVAGDMKTVSLDDDVRTDVDDMFGDNDDDARLKKPASLAKATSNQTFLNRDQSYEGINAAAATDEKLPKLGTMAVSKRLFKLGMEERGMLFLATLALVVSSVASMAIPALVGNLIDALSVDHDMQKLNMAVFGMFVLTSVSSIFTLIRNILFTVAGERVVTRLRKMLFAAIMSQEIGFFDTNKTGELVNRLASDSQVVQNAVTVNVSMALRFTGQLLVGFGFLFVISWKLTLVMLSILPLIIGGGWVYGKYVKKVSQAVQDALAKSGDVASEVLGAIRTVRSFSKDFDEVKKYTTCVEESYRLSAQRAIARGVFAGIATQLGGMAVLGVLWYGGYLVIQNELTPGTLTSFILYTLTVSVAVGVMSELYGDFMKAVGSSERVFQLIDRVPAIPMTGGAPLPSKIQGVVQFENVHFAYPSRPKTIVLESFNLTLQPGKVVALVGPSGGGKSTCVSLLLGFYRPQTGKILIDGIDIATLSPSAYRRTIATVSQEPTLFATSVAENIAYGVDRDVTDEEIIAAAKVANAHKFISGFEKGYHTLVGERGIVLSGGQKQRVAIARAVLKNPTILLLDEATSALDAESEHLVKEALEKLMKGRTVLVIAHRLSTVKNADLVVVVNKGQIAESGTHESLCARDGLYKKLVQHQLAAD